MSTRFRLVIAMAVLAAMGVRWSDTPWPGAMLAGQSLGELARQEEARRKAVKSPGKVYTNETLGKGGVPPPPRQTAAPAPPPAAVAEAAAPEGATPKADEPKKDEAYWKTRIEGARLALSRAQIFAEALQSRINALSADFAARDDPAQRAIVGAEREKALAELARVKQEMQQYAKAVADIQDEARRAGVPPGWLR